MFGKLLIALTAFSAGIASHIAWKKHPKRGESPQPDRDAPLPDAEVDAVVNAVISTADPYAEYPAEVRETVAQLEEFFASHELPLRSPIQYEEGVNLTRYILFPGKECAIERFTELEADLSLALSADILMQPLCGKDRALTMDIPHTTRETASLADLLTSETAMQSVKPLEFPLGVGFGKRIQLCNLAAMPHLLIAGAMGSGKTECLHSMLLSLACKNSPADLRLVLLDPGNAEYTPYADLPHLYTPVVTDTARAIAVLLALVGEMERRCALLRDVGVRDVEGYNQSVQGDPSYEHLPRIVVCVEEYAALILAWPNKTPERLLIRLAQKGRPAGLHLVVATQHLTPDILTGRLKNNMLSRIAFALGGTEESYLILDANGAESLLGQGDMLYKPTGCAQPMRLQGACVKESEIVQHAEALKGRHPPVRYNRAFLEIVEEELTHLPTDPEDEEE